MTNPKQNIRDDGVTEEAELRGRVMFEDVTIEDFVVGLVHAPREYRERNISHAIKRIAEYGDTHTTKLLNEQLDRLKEQAVTPPGYVEVKVVTLSAIENERKKL